MSIPPGDSSSWALLHDHLTQAVMALADGHRLTIEAPEELARPGRISGLRRVLGQKHPTLTPWVTLERLEDHLIARCVRDDKEIGFPLLRDQGNSAYMRLAPTGPDRRAGLRAVDPRRRAQRGIPARG